jgi:hypothetical protein
VESCNEGFNSVHHVMRVLIPFKEIFELQSVEKN